MIIHDYIVVYTQSMKYRYITRTNNRSWKLLLQSWFLLVFPYTNDHRSQTITYDTNDHNTRVVTTTRLRPLRSKRGIITKRSYCRSYVTLAMFDWLKLCFYPTCNVNTYYKIMIQLFSKMLIEIKATLYQISQFYFTSLLIHNLHFSAIFI